MMGQSPEQRARVRRARLVKAGLNRVSLVTAIVVAPAALLLAWLDRAFFGAKIWYVAIPLLAVVAISLVSVAVRVGYYGFLRRDADRHLSSKLRRRFRYWLMVKYGLAAATMYLLVGIAVGAIVGWKVTLALEAVALIGLGMIFGNALLTTALNASLIRYQRRRPIPPSVI